MRSPGISTNILLALVRLFVWIGVLPVTDKGPVAVRILLKALWITAFLWRYVWRKGPYFPEKLDDPLYASRVFKRPPRALVLYILALFFLTAIAVPWWGAAFTGGCGRAEWLDFVYAPRSSLVDPPAGLFLSVVYLLLTIATFPLIEEFSMRGWFLQPMRNRFGTQWAVFTSAFLFAVLHLVRYPRQFVTIFVVALGYGYAVVATGSIWASIAMHYAWNLSSHLLRVPAIHPRFASVYGTGLFRCGMSHAMVVLTATTFALVLMGARSAMRRASPPAIAKAFDDVVK
jgi:membrane protease YdiL (CAAX protease family)